MERQEADHRTLADQSIARRSLLKGAGAGALAVGTLGREDSCPPRLLLRIPCGWILRVHDSGQRHRGAPCGVPYR